MKNFYRVKEINTYNVTYYIPQYKFLWWWRDFKKMSSSDIMTGDVDYYSLKFNTKKECEDFLKEKFWEEKVTYHYCN